MPRLARKSIKAKFIHVVVEGIKKEFIFYKEKYKSEYILLLKKYISEMSNSKLIAYCVMSNHVHILFYTENIEEISTLMRRINTSYAIYYNKNEERVGYVFANRYYSQPISNQVHLVTCIQYIHQNPVKAGLVKLAKEYRFSSFREFSGNKLDTEMAKLIFGTKNYFTVFCNLNINNNIEIIDVLEEPNKLKLEDLINSFCKEFKVNLSQVKKSNYLILKFKEYLNQNFKITNKTICGILGIGKNRIKSLENKLK